MWPAMFGNIPPMYSLGQPTTNSNTINFTGGPWTFTRTEVASSAETISTWKTAGDSIGNIIFKNSTTTDNTFGPQIQMQVAGSSLNNLQSYEVQTDSGTASAITWRAQTIAGAALATRPLFQWNNWTSVVGQIKVAGTFFGATDPGALSSMQLTGHLADTNTSGSRGAVQGFVSATASGSSSAEYHGFYGRTNTLGSQNYTSGVAAQSFKGINSHAGSGTVSGSVNFYAAGTTNTGGGTVTNWFGLYVASNTTATNNYAIYTDGSSRIQFGTSTQGYLTNAFLSARNDYTSTSGSSGAIVGQVSPAPASASTAQFTALSGYVNNSNANTTGASLYAVDVRAQSSTAVATIVGGLYDARVTGAVTVSTVTGVNAQVNNTSTGTITTATALNAQGSNSGGGTITTFYGLRVPSAASIATTAWGVYVDTMNSFFGGDVSIGTAGKGLKVKEGSNARMGRSTLVGGTVTVNNTSVTASTRIFISRAVGGGTRGYLEVGTVTAATSFVINSTDAAGALVADTSQIDWLLVEPA